jgi:hypothetical protein
MVEIAKKSKTLTTSWILLFVLGLLLTLLSLVSLGLAYFGGQDVLIQGVNLDKLAEVDPRLPNIIRGRRATASSASLSLGILLAWVAATAYRRGERWAWSALLVSLGAGSILSLLRYITLQTTLGLLFAGIVLGVLLVALLIAYKDFH